MQWVMKAWKVGLVDHWRRRGKRTPRIRYRRRRWDVERRVRVMAVCAVGRMSLVGGSLER